MNVPAWTKSSFKKYRIGGYQSGTATWDKYVKGTNNYIGNYYTTESGWAPGETTNIVYTETAIPH